MADPEQINADQRTFWKGQGGRTWVARQEHTDITLAPVSEALLALAAARSGERVLDVGCGCGASTLDIARAVGRSGRVAALDISGPMLAEGQRRAEGAGIANVDWQEADPATAALGGYDLMVSNFGVMFFGDPVAAFAHMRSAARLGARMVFVCWRPVTENPWMKVPMYAVSAHLAPRPKSGSTCARNVRLRRSRARCRGAHLSRLGAAADRQPRPRSRHRCRPRAGGGCGSVDPNRRRQ